MIAFATLCLAATNADLSQVQSVYVMPMSGGLHQHLTNRLIKLGLFQIVADPLRADSVLTDRLGAAVGAGGGEATSGVEAAGASDGPAATGTGAACSAGFREGTTTNNATAAARNVAASPGTSRRYGRRFGEMGEGGSCSC